MQIRALPFFSLSLLSSVRAGVTVYGQIPLADVTATAPGQQYTGAAAYDPTILTPPPIPNPPPNTQFGIQLSSSAQNTPGLSIPQIGPFLGFSIEVSVVNQVLGLNSSFLQVPFLNLMANIKERAGAVHVRVGGNTQEYASIVPSLEDGKDMEKDKTSLTNPTATPGLFLTPEVFYMLGNISALANVHWYLGVPFNDTTNFRLQIAEISEAVLGDHLLGLQVGNEPDLYSAHGHRPDTYSPADYMGEFGNLIGAIANDNNIPVKNNLIGPSVSGQWTPEDVWNTGFVQAYTNSLGYLAVEHYPTDNCFAQYNVGVYHNPQDEFPSYLTHNAGKQLVQPYLNSTYMAQIWQKPFLMFETNTASCGGFPGISDSYGSALWALDFGLQMAASNFSGAMLHVGGQNVFYNPFTPPPTNQTNYHQWTIGPIYYSALAVAELMGPSGKSQIIDLNANGGNEFTPGYAVYESGKLVKLALFNYVTDPTGASTYTATLSIDTGVPSQIKVKYLESSSVSNKAENITWAGQTLGGVFQADGRLTGNLDIKTVNCDQTANQCHIQVPAPGFAIAFLDQNSYNDVNPGSPQTFATTAWTRTFNTATMEPSVLATSNGRQEDSYMGSTSRGESGANTRAYVSSGVVATVMVLVGAMMVGRGL
ncbi:glycoside hydrolase family 79 protein [Hydnomerulius pinastri MD-312]|uniref:Glycoside hydrolase family 79 protein n=1 Tax=Hydnomerulius pinastri MD-312 TaxID=994086 RepID=A0A0C9V7W3_9AGAM|nr:glycoside hydrolase family 79 protein [Hydnomerulius pinastri MD-312]